MKKILFFLIGLLLITGCNNKSTNQLNVLNWTSYIPDDVISDFEEEYNIKVNYGTYSSNEELLAKLSSSKKGTYDVVFPSDYMVSLMKEKKMLNKIDNAKFLCGDVSKLISENIDCDILIVDPPRIGLDNHTINVINKKNVNKLIYVSCDPMTLVRDLSRLDSYELSKISVVDMFPQTHHVESVVLLNKKM